MSNRRYYDMRDYLDKIDRQLHCLECKVDSSNEIEENVPIETNDTGGVTNDYLKNKNLLAIIGEGHIYELGKNFNKPEESNTVEFINDTELLNNTTYTFIFGKIIS